jgi:hypothetical protein
MAVNTARPTMISGRIPSAPRYTASINQLNGMALANSTKQNTTVVEEKEPEIDMREAERNACMNNNIGIGNTFVWASRFSDTSNYATMVEDTVNPQNNVCFVRVELKSDNESRISVSDVPAKYFMWGESIDCGSWANEKEMEKRILDARKGARIGGIVASTVGGAGLGVGVMELIGNTSIKGWTGQKELSGTQLYRSVLKSYNVNSVEYQNVVNALTVLKQACAQNPSIEGCDTYKDLIAEFAK